MSPILIAFKVFTLFFSCECAWLTFSHHILQRTLFLRRNLDYSQVIRVGDGRESLLIQSPKVLVSEVYDLSWITRTQGKRRILTPKISSDLYTHDLAHLHLRFLTHKHTHTN